MNTHSILHWFQPLMSHPLVWQPAGSAGGIRAITSLVDDEGKSIEYLNLVTACAALKGFAFHSGDYHSAAEAIGMPDALASAMIRADDNNLPESHEYFVPLARLVDYLANGRNL